MSTKKKNFTGQEIALVIEITRDFKDIIKSKKSDKMTARAKTIAWHKIAERYNTSNVITEIASPYQLRRLWTNLKTRQKQRERLSLDNDELFENPNTSPTCNEEDSEHIRNFLLQEDKYEEINFPGDFVKVQSDEKDYSIMSNREDNLRYQILKDEYLNKEKRAREMHILKMTHLKQKHELEVQLLQLQVAKLKAELENKKETNSIKD